MNFIIDFFFLVDMILTFYSAFYDENLMIVDNKKQIAKRYLQGWFTIDLLAIIPFEYVT